MNNEVIGVSVDDATDVADEDTVEFKTSAWWLSTQQSFHTRGGKTHCAEGNPETPLFLRSSFCQAKPSPSSSSASWLS